MDRTDGTELNNYLTNICHELQSPLQGIFGNLEQLRKSIQALKPSVDSAIVSELDDYINGIDVSVKHQMAITSKFLTSAKLEEAKIDLHPSVVVPNKVINDVIKMFRPNLNKKQHIVVEFPSEDLYLEADETQLKQIAINLIGNALKFTVDGIITVSLSCSLDPATSIYELVFAVSDTGIGMTEEEQQRLFRRFSQANTAIATQFGGFGLGLVICKGLVDLMGGKILVESKKEVGSKFTVILNLPRARNPHDQTPTNATPASKEISTDGNTLVVAPRRLPTSFLDLVATGGDMGQYMLSIDWSKTDLGPITSWPRSLMIAVNICLKNEFPMTIWWGPTLVLIYNDNYRPYLGDKHPAMGKRGLEIWGDIKGSILPMLEGAFAGDISTFEQNMMLVMERNGFAEEVFFTFSLSPIFDEEMKVVGVMNICIETTKKVQNTRRMDLLREISGANKTGAIRDVCVSMSNALATCPADLPFTLMYLFDDNEDKLVLQSHTGLEPGTGASPYEFHLRTDTGVWPFAAVINSTRAIKVSDLTNKVGFLPGGIWPEPANHAVILPIISNTQDRPIGVFVAGISPRQLYDSDYQSFAEMVVGHIAKALDTVRSYEEQKKRAEELAKIDHAKTLFFTNVSHEFRTPLSLMLGPLADSLADHIDPLNEKQRSRQTMIQRNALRLLKLVNTILDFSRIEAGKAQIAFAPTDISKLTRELCQLFTSVMEQSSLKYVVEVEPIETHVYVDVEMWEKIVMNLISNAYKFTLKGTIFVSLKRVDNAVELLVQDSGVGIPEKELPNMFRRFHRIESSQGRSFEGSGIGLALIQELTKLHGGTISVASTLGEGTTFTVQIPLGSDHLPKDKIQEGGVDDSVELSLHSRSIVDEATRWGTDSSKQEQDVHEPDHSPRSYRILLVDDNNDMRNYIKQILSKAWHVDTSVDGEEGYEMACANPPDLVVSDVMMPRLDGFGLIKKLRENPVTKSIPIILLSARAGEEAKVEGLGHGADDYLVKTSFSEKELLARVKNHLELGRLRMHLEREVDKKTKELRHLNTALYEFIDMICHEIRNPLHGITGSWELLSERLFSLEKAWQSVSKHSAPINHFDQSLATNLLDMKEYLSNLEECTTHQTRVMDEVVLLTKLYSNKFELSHAVCDPAALLAEIVTLHGDRLEQRGVTVELQPVKFGLRVKVDIRCLTHVINALLVYVIDAVPTGSNVVLSQSLNVVNEQTSQLTTRITCGNFVIDQASFEELISLQQHSFASRSMGSHYSNTGFTLSISNLLVKVMGGNRIQVLNDSHREAVNGFNFNVTCYSISDELGIRTPEVPRKARVHTKHVLVAEDNYINQVLCKCLLKKQGYTCELANDGKEALEKYKPDRFDFVLMDVAMPELDGIEVTRRIRALEKQQNVAHPTFIIGLSAYAQPEKIVEAIDAGMNDFISKPATFDKIVHIISQWASADSNKKKNKEEMLNQNVPKPKTKGPKKDRMPVLVVEDNIINQTLIKNLLKKQGHETVLAATGPEVLDKFKPEEFSLILMDLTLPFMSGIEVTKKIREIETNQKAKPTVIVGLSAHTDEKLIASAKDAGMHDYMTKPASMEKIYVMLNRWIDL